MRFSEGDTFANLEPNWLPNGVQNDAGGTVLVSRVRQVGDGNEKMEVQKSFRNTFEKRLDVVSARPAEMATVIYGGGAA